MKNKLYIGVVIYSYPDWEKCIHSIEDFFPNENKIILNTGKKYQYGVKIENCLAKAWNEIIRCGLQYNATHFLICSDDIVFNHAAQEQLVQKINDCPQIIYNAEEPFSHAFCISRKLIEEVGYFDESFAPIFFEDTDFHLRVKQYERKNNISCISFYPGVLHVFSGTAKTEGYSWANTIIEKNKNIFCDKWGIREKGINVIGDIVGGLPVSGLEFFSKYDYIANECVPQWQYKKDNEVYV